MTQSGSNPDGRGPPRAQVAELFARYSRPLLTFFRRHRGVTGDDAKDLLSSTFMEVLQYLERDPDRTLQYPRGFLYKVAFRHLRRHREEQSRNPSALQETDLQQDVLLQDQYDQHMLSRRKDADFLVELHDAQQSLRQAMNHLEPDLEAMLDLHYWEGLSVEQLARVFERPVSWISSELQRARAAMEAELKPPLDVEARNLDARDIARAFPGFKYDFSPSPPLLASEGGASATQHRRAPTQPSLEGTARDRRTADVEQKVYDRIFASRMKSMRLALARRDADWSRQWLAIEDEYEERCSLARSLLGDGVEDVALHDGHVAELVLTARALLDRGAELFGRAPWVRHLHVTRYHDVGSSLFESQLLRGIQSLGLNGEALEDGDVAELVESPHIDGLRWLDLSYNNLGERSFELLATCPALVHLEYLGLDGNPAESPVDHMGTDPLDGTVVSTLRTPLGRALEALAGELKWLHAPARFPYSYPPSPLDVASMP